MHVARCPPVEFSIVHVDVKIGQKRLSGADPLDPFQRQLEMGMGRVWTITHGVDDQDLDPGHRREGRFGQRHHIVGVGDIAKPKSQRAYGAAMALPERDDIDPGRERLREQMFPQPKEVTIASGAVMARLLERFVVLGAGVFLKEFELVAGASAGALNAWPIASGMPPSVLQQLWLKATVPWLRRPANLETMVQNLVRDWRPKIEIGVVVSQGWRSFWLAIAPPRRFMCATKSKPAKRWASIRYLKNTTPN